MPASIITIKQHCNAVSFYLFSQIDFIKLFHFTIHLEANKCSIYSIYLHDNSVHYINRCRHDWDKTMDLRKNVLKCSCFSFTLNRASCYHFIALDVKFCIYCQAGCIWLF